MTIDYLFEFTQVICRGCHAEIYLNEHAAKLYNPERGILCPKCRSAEKWTRATYTEYLNTYHWSTMRLKALVNAGHKCQVCASTEKLEVHHNDYSRLGGELLTDLVVLCHDCHTLFHGV